MRLPQLAASLVVSSLLVGCTTMPNVMPMQKKYMFKVQSVKAFDKRVGCICHKDSFGYTYNGQLDYLVMSPNTYCRYDNLRLVNKVTKNDGSVETYYTGQATVTKNGMSESYPFTIRGRGMLDGERHVVIRSKHCETRGVVVVQ